MPIVMPTFDHEMQLWQAGYQYIAGVDEVGRGALAGPVVAAAVIIAQQTPLAGIWAQVCDSKLLTPAQRAALEIPLQTAALAWGIGSASAAIIDQIGIAAATRQAMGEAVAALQPRPDYLLIDWVRLAQVKIPQTSSVKADLHMVSVAAASILAKVYRDRLLTQLHEQYPGYGFHQHKGYGTRAHLAALTDQGPCPEHRHTFAPVARSTLISPTL
ncbi:MAG: ribonuclease HII [Chloroflexi bacterium]|nr:ribonuclease HII [Chloroflexota bacterium]